MKFTIGQKVKIQEDPSNIWLSVIEKPIGIIIATDLPIYRVELRRLNGRPLSLWFTEDELKPIELSMEPDE